MCLIDLFLPADIPIEQLRFVLLFFWLFAFGRWDRFFRTICVNVFGKAAEIRAGVFGFKRLFAKFLVEENVDAIFSGMQLFVCLFFRIFILLNFYVPSSAVFYQKKGVCAVLLVVYKCFYYNRN